MNAPKPGQHTRLLLTQFIAGKKGLASCEVEGEVVAATDKALRVKAHVVIRAAQHCLNCHQTIDHPASRLVGYGPVCAARLGIPRPEKLTPEIIEEVRARISRDTEVEDWFPLSQLTVLEVSGTPAAPVFRPPREQVRECDHNGSAFLLRTPFDNFGPLYKGVKAIPGAMWFGGSKVWQVPTEAVDDVKLYVTRHRFTITEAAQAVFDGIMQAMAASTATDADIDVPGLGRTLYPFQRAGVAYLVDKKRAILGDEMGCGKTAQSLATLQKLDAFPAIIVSPASVKLNWLREVRMWLPSRTATVLSGTSKLPRTLSDITVLNYDILHKFVDGLAKKGYKAVVFDESHNLKTRAARRTRACKKLAQPAVYRLALTGTAVLNKPQELASQLEILGRLEEFGGHADFVGRYKYASPRSLVELNRKLRSACYVARKKVDVLKELPPKTQAVVPLELDNWEEYQYAEDDLIGWLRQNAVKDAKFLFDIGGLSFAQRKEAMQARADDAEIRGRSAETLVRMNALRRLAARGKLAGAIGWIEDFLEDSDEKLVVFAHHQEIVNAVADRFACPCIMGETSLPVRQAAVDAFQTDDRVRVIACNLQAGGVGLTLTAASNVALLELPWSPALLDQAVDRTHRIGQDDAVTAWLLLGAQTIDERMASLLDSKRQVVDAVLLGEETDTASGILSELVSQYREAA